MEPRCDPARRAGQPPRPRRQARTCAVLALSCSACALHSYRREPLPDDPLTPLAHEREHAGEAGGTGGLTLALAAEWLRTRGPRVREAVAAYRTALARAAVPTPWPNPMLEVGPEFGFGPGVDQNEVVPFGRLGLAIPLSGRLGRQDEVNTALALVARAEALATFRELYLDLRARWLRLLVAQRRRAVRAGVLAGAEESLAAALELAEAGGATALDVSLFQLEHAREQGRAVGADLEVADAAADLSELVAVSPWRLGTVPGSALPAAPDEVPGFAELRALAVAEHPDLLRLRAAYEVAERRLHLEITEQYPDLTLGVSAGGETGERKTVLGLGLGIELPLFDRNEQAIAEAAGRRDELRTVYESTAHRVLAALERARARLLLAADQHRVLREAVLPAAEQNVAIAQQSVSAGAAGGLQLLDAERSLRQVRIEVLDAALGELLAWSELEKAAGFPLVRHAGEAAADAPAPPAGLEADPRPPEGGRP